MQEFIDWFSEYYNLIPFVQVFVAGVTAFATVVLAFVTWNLARVSKRSPFVICNIESSAASVIALHLIIKNTGNATAFDINAKIFPALPDIHGNPCKDKTETNFCISLLPPNQGFPYMSFQVKDIPEEPFDVIVSWASKPKGRKRKSISYTMGTRDDFGRGWEEKGLDQIARELKLFKPQFEKIARYLERITKHLEPPQDKK